VTGPWARALLDRYGSRDGAGGGGAADVKVEPSLVTGCVDGRPVAISAPPIAAGIWAAVDAQVDGTRQSEELAHDLDHTWDEPLVPAEIVRVGAADDVDALVRALAEEVERAPATLLRWRGYGAAPAAGEDAWRGGELPPLPPRARRPPDSVPKRFGASGISTPDGDLVEVLVRAYRAFADDGHGRPRG
jgi:hypothetical protein